ncbi:hypothetical protein MNBD_GAMMA09-959 [hydrothermal vent metagenome]|uniref:Uncharacterized protein n=1 Tax=hydrothermal vent metagenome TaxID=652676 RepID=A0A3B0X8J7_9ZZZZ
MQYIKLSMVILFVTTAGMEGKPAFALDKPVAQEKYQNFNWKSPNGWEGAVFDVPTWFAKDMLYTGREVIRFHDGFYDRDSTGFWTYAFALLVEQTGVPTTQAITEETKRYFLGLARDLGDKKDVDYSASKIHVKPVSQWTVDKTTKRRSQNYRLEIFDSFTTGKPITLNVRVTSWPCSDKYRAIHYALSPHDMTQPIWGELDKEVSALTCW